GEPVRGAELTRLGAQAADAANVAAFRGDLLHVVVRRGNPDPILRADGDGDGALEAPGAPEMPGADLVIPPGEQEGAGRLEALHAAEGAVGGVDVPPAVERQEVRAADPGCDRDVAAELARLDAVAPPGADGLAAGRQFLHAPVHLVGDVDRPVRA